ncbi:TolC family outer membrane protein [Vibrio sp. SCSIO 43137]|uniref:TolC family outer membrane protein n=1 Tax=Vibrio sp. SCSIO 43137 TaxID=3021011 RepID=UPI0023080BED|nr:TolC family outer membrane protein [Vibrio sp. SCSIO 43137]WCE31058.1 TolC family outer membrane protein [Vibrio sp. SCSIO 43137]
MTLKRTRLVTLACLVALSFGANSQTLEQAIATTISTNPEIKSAYNDYMSYVELNNVAFGHYMPSLDLDAGIGKERTSQATGSASNFTRKDATLRLTQLLWDGSSTLNDIDRTAAEAESMRLQVVSSAQDKALEVSRVYLNAVQAQEVLRLSEKNLAIHKRIYRDIKRRAESGIGSTADLSQVETRLASAQSNLLAAQNNIFDTHTQFTRLVGQAPMGLIFPRVDETAIPVSVEEATTISEQKHPVLKIAAADIDAARYQYKQSKGTNLPTFSIEAAQTWYDDAAGIPGRRNESSAMLRMRYNLFNGGSDAATQDRMAYQLNKAKDLRDNAHRSLTESLRLSWSALDLTLQQKEFLADQVDSAAETVIAYEKQYRIGKRTLLDLLNSENELFEARRAYLTASYDEQYAKYRVLNACGILLDSLLVDMPAEWNQAVEY